MAKAGLPKPDQRCPIGYHSTADVARGLYNIHKQHCHPHCGSAVYRWGIRTVGPTPNNLVTMTCSNLCMARAIQDTAYGPEFVEEPIWLFVHRYGAAREANTHRAG